MSISKIKVKYSIFFLYFFYKWFYPVKSILLSHMIQIHAYMYGFVYMYPEAGGGRFPKSFKSFFILLFPFPACFIQSYLSLHFYRFEFSLNGNSHLFTQLLCTMITLKFLYLFIFFISFFCLTVWYLLRYFYEIYT